MSISLSFTISKWKIKIESTEFCFLTFVHSFHQFQINRIGILLWIEFARLIQNSKHWYRIIRIWIDEFQIRGERFRHWAGKFGLLIWCLSSFQILPTLTMSAECSNRIRPMDQRRQKSVGNHFFSKTKFTFGPWISETKTKLPHKSTLSLAHSVALLLPPLPPLPISISCVIMPYWFSRIAATHAFPHQLDIIIWFKARLVEFIIILQGWWKLSLFKETSWCIRLPCGFRNWFQTWNWIFCYNCSPVLFVSVSCELIFAFFIFCF